jgi:hypothetical protein
MKYGIMGNLWLVYELEASISIDNRKNINFALKKMRFYFINSLPMNIAYKSNLFVYGAG